MYRSNKILTVISFLIISIVGTYITLNTDQFFSASNTLNLPAEMTLEQAHANQQAFHIYFYPLALCEVKACVEPQDYIAEMPASDNEVVNVVVIPLHGTLTNNQQTFNLPTVPNLELALLLAECTANLDANHNGIIADAPFSCIFDAPIQHLIVDNFA